MCAYDHVHVCVCGGDSHTLVMGARSVGKSRDYMTLNRRAAQSVHALCRKYFGYALIGLSHVCVCDPDAILCRCQNKNAGIINAHASSTREDYRTITPPNQHIILAGLHNITCTWQSYVKIKRSTLVKIALYKMR